MLKMYLIDEIFDYPGNANEFIWKGTIRNRDSSSFHFK